MIHTRHTHSHADNRAEIFQIHTADTLEGINMAENSALFLTQGGREQGRERLCLGCSCVAVGIDRFNQQGLGSVEQEETQAGG